MPKLSLSVPHSLGAEEAARRLKERYDEVKAEHGSSVRDLDEQWDGRTLRCRFQAMGLKVAGSVTAHASSVEVEAELPLAAAMFKGVIETRVREELGKLLA
jgi:hypothetical protein